MNNINQSFQNDSTWNWNVEQSAASQNPVNYYPMEYSSQNAYTASSIEASSQLPANNNQVYSEADIEQIQPHNYQTVPNLNPIKIDNEEEIKTEQSTETPDRYEDHLEPAMSDISKNSMTPQWSIESQVSQDSDDISSSTGQVGGLSPVSGSQSKSEDIDQRLYGYGSSGENQNNWEDTEDDEEILNTNTYPEPVNDSSIHAPPMSQSDGQSNVDETITALESLNLTHDNSGVNSHDTSASQPVPGISNLSLEPPLPTIGPPTSSGPSLMPAGPPPSSGKASVLPPASSGPSKGLAPAAIGPPSGLALTSIGPPPGLPPASSTGMSASASNPYSVSRGGLTHKSATKMFSSTGNNRPVYTSPSSLSSGLESTQINQERPPRISRPQDNHESSDTVESRSYEPPAGQVRILFMC